MGYHCGVLTDATFFVFNKLTKLPTETMANMSSSTMYKSLEKTLKIGTYAERSNDAKVKAAVGKT